MDDSEYRVLKTGISHIVHEGLDKFLECHSDDDKHLYELVQHIEHTKANDYTWDMEKIKIMLSVLQLKEPSDVQEILSYLNQSDYGWQGDTYKVFNRCIHLDQRCRRNCGVENDADVTSRVFLDMDEIFLHKEYGAVTTYLFGYCLAALFSSLLKTQHRGIPYVLQVACRRNSNTYRLVHEIVQICDVNAGIFDQCHEFHYAECDHDHATIYPKGTLENALDSLLYYRDIPVVVDGYENEKLYLALLRETANIPNRNKRLDLNAKFKMLPIFLCPTLQSQFRNVFSMDLTELEIDDEYIDLISSYRQRLGSWVYELVRDAEKYFDAGNSTSYLSLSETQRLVELRKYGGKIPLLYDLDDNTNRLRTRYGGWPGITSKDITNTGYLAYFFSHFMKVFERSIRLSEGTQFTYRTRQGRHNPSKLVRKITDEAVDSLLRLHATYAPTRQETIHIDVDSPDAAERKRIKRKGTAYAKDIIKYYQSYDVSISIAPEAEYRDGRYVFSVKLMPGTNVKLLGRHADEVRRLLEVEVLTFDLTPHSIRLIVSEKPLHENSLIKILESQDFKESQMEIPYAVGYDVMGEMVIADVAQFPHLLVGGTSGSGKSSALFSLIMSIVYKQPPDKVKLLLFDFGGSDLKTFDKVPHMLQPTIRVHEIERGRQCILWLQGEMERRLKEKDSLDEGVFIEQFKRWPSIVCVIDESPVFIQGLTNGRGNKKSSAVIEDLLARARKVKIHLVLAAQDTTKDGIGIKNTNLAAGIAFRCTNWHTSKVIIGESDAVNLYGKGAMYFRCDQYEGLRRLQGSFMPTEEIMSMLHTMNFSQCSVGHRYDDVKLTNETLQVGSQSGTSPITCDSGIEVDPDEQCFIEIVKWIRDDKKETISNKQLKDKFEMGYDRANRFLQRLEDAGIISEQKKGTKLPRTVKQDKLEEFLNSHEDTGSAGGAASNQTLDSSAMPTDVESTQDQSTESPDEISDTQAQLSSATVPRPTRLKCDHRKLMEETSPKNYRAKSTR